MTKQFFDVFPTLKVNSDCKVLFENVEVTKLRQIQTETTCTSIYSVRICLRRAGFIRWKQ